MASPEGRLTAAISIIRLNFADRPSELGDVALRSLRIYHPSPVGKPDRLAIAPPEARFLKEIGLRSIFGNWGLGIGDWGLVIGNW